MFNMIKFNIVIGTALAVLFLSPIVLAADDSNIKTDWQKVRFDDDSPDNIKARSTPGNTAAGAEKSLLCQGCHGEKGLTADTMLPHLAGQYSQYISKNLRNFQTGERTHQIMSAMAATISDADLADISAYFASQPKMAGDGSGETSPTAQAGKNLFLKGDASRMVLACISCHGVSGKGRTPHISKFPVIGGQQAGYLRQQLISWRSGERTNSANGIMNRIAKSLTTAEIDSLAEYISSL